MVMRTAFMWALPCSFERLPRTRIASPTAADRPSKPERSVWRGLPRSICQTTPSVALTRRVGCGGDIEMASMVPSSSDCSSTAQFQPWWASAGLPKDRMAPPASSNDRRREIDAMGRDRPAAAPVSGELGMLRSPGRGEVPRGRSDTLPRGARPRQLRCGYQPPPPPPPPPPPDPPPPPEKPEEEDFGGGTALANEPCVAATMPAIERAK